MSSGLLDDRLDRRGASLLDLPDDGEGGCRVGRSRWWCDNLDDGLGSRFSTAAARLAG